EDPESVKGLEIGLDSCAATGIGARDGERDYAAGARSLPILDIGAIAQLDAAGRLATRRLKAWKFGVSTVRVARIASSIASIRACVCSMRSSSSGCVENQASTPSG